MICRLRFKDRGVFLALQYNKIILKKLDILWGGKMGTLLKNRKKGGRKMKKLSLLMVGVLLLFGCGTLQVMQMDPKPNVNISKASQTIALSINKDIEDNYLIPPGDIAASIQVQQWHESLKKGFINCFGDSYKIVEDKAKADLILTLKRADISFDLIAINPDSTNSALVTAQIAFTVQLTDSKGNIIGRTAKTAKAKRSTYLRDEFTNVARSAVESMYEITVEDIFKK